jgi:hypothetical protein
MTPPLSPPSRTHPEIEISSDLIWLIDGKPYRKLYHPHAT